MIRFPNPGSNIDQLVNIYRNLYANLADFTSFDLNNMADILTQLNLASSSGYIGEEALRRSYLTSDLTRNPLYNQAKMYAEVYRILGWIKSTAESALKFNFTYLGSHIAPLENNPRALVEESLLGIIYPNETISVAFEDVNRPFITILRALTELDGFICRDELIIGPLSIVDSRDETAFQNMISKIRTLRRTQKKESLLNELGRQSELLNIQENTMQNYTRFVISSLEYVGWITKVNKKIYRRNMQFLVLSDAGIEKYNQIKDHKYIFNNDIDKKDETLTKAISSIGFLSMLDRAHFNVESELDKQESYLNLLESKFQTNKILFSPFQFFDDAGIKIFLPQYANAELEDTVTLDFNHELSGSSIPDQITVTNIPFSPQNEQILTSKKSRAEILLTEILNQHDGDIEGAIGELLLKILPMKQSDFYLLFAELFTTIGLSAKAPPAGVNNERWDVIIPDSEYTIPVEVKSPTEEKTLSVKAIRQALENKIVLLSRKSYITDFDCVSLAIGFEIPIASSEVYKLIEEIHEVYKINIGILSVKTLLSIALDCIKYEKKCDIAILKNARGVIEYENVYTT